MNINATDPNLDYQEAEVVNDTAEVQIKESKVLDAFALTPELHAALLEYFKNVPLKSLGDSESEKLYNIYSGLKNAIPMKVTVTNG